jgi:hypothetical protein
MFPMVMACVGEREMMPKLPELRASTLDRQLPRRKKGIEAPLVLMCLVGLISLSSAVVHPQSVDLVEIDTEAVAKGWRLSYLINHLVMNERDEIVGTIDDLIVDEDGKLFAVVEVGDFLPRGSRPLIAVSYDSLSIDKERLIIRLPGASRDKLNRMPVFKYRD